MPRDTCSKNLYDDRSEIRAARAATLAWYGGLLNRVSHGIEAFALVLAGRDTYANRIKYCEWITKTKRVLHNSTRTASCCQLRYFPDCSLPTHERTACATPSANKMNGLLSMSLATPTSALKTCEGCSWVGSNLAGRV